MPTYEYKCSACDHAFERFQSIMAGPVRRCPECGKAKVKRLIGTGAGLIFKGSGFYITDYRSEGYKDKAKADTGGGEAKTDNKTADAKAAAAESKSASDGGEAKPVAKPEAAPAPKAEPKPTKSEGKSTKKS